MVVQLLFNDLFEYFFRCTFYGEEVLTCKVANLELGEPDDKVFRTEDFPLRVF